MTSDFFLEEADEWRDEVWGMIRRPDVHFWLLTKWAFRIRECLPWDWQDGWDKDGREYHICKAYQHIEALRSGLQYPPVSKEVPIQKRCASCQRRTSCNGCHWCGKYKVV